MSVGPVRVELTTSRMTARCSKFGIVYPVALQVYFVDHSQALYLSVPFRILDRFYLSLVEKVSGYFRPITKRSDRNRDITFENQMKTTVTAHAVEM